MNEYYIYVCYFLLLFKLNQRFKFKGGSTESMGIGERRRAGGAVPDRTVMRGGGQLRLVCQESMYLLEMEYCKISFPISFCITMFNQ